MLKNILLIFIFLFSPIFTYANTVLDGVISSNMKFIKENSPYILESDVAVSYGVKIEIDSGVEIIFNGFTLDIRGHLYVNGRENEIVSLKGGDFGGYVSIYNLSANTKINNAVFDNVSLYQNSGHIDIRNSIFKNSDIAISFFKNSFDIYNSQILNNRVGLSFENFLPFLMRLFNKIVYAKSDYVITNSIFENNIIAIDNQSDLNMDAKNNWWNTVDLNIIDNSLEGLVEYIPILTETPNVCCSSVIFIPGLQGSRLYKEGIFGKNRIWEPSSDFDISNLFLNEKGESIVSGIYTKGIIDTADFLGLYRKNIYKSLIEDAIDFEIFDYDWRYDPENIVSSNFLYEKVLNLSRSSKNRKVSIVAHSAGGLITRELLNKITESNNEDLIDKVVFVAVPHIGTPMAYSSLVYGEGQDLGFGFVMSKNQARTLAKNMPMAYTLLPTREYLEHENIDMNEELYNRALYQRAKAFHESSHSFENYDVYNIVGLNIPTLTNIKYVNKNKIICPQSGYCTNYNYEDIEPVLSMQGDGTVTSYSAIGKFKKQYRFDLSKEKVKHANIFESKNIRDCVSNILSSIGCNMAEDFSFLKEDKFMIISVHSPVDISIMKDDKYTGKIFISDDVYQVVSDVENSLYFEFGEGKYIVLYGDDYKDSQNNIRLEGTDYGYFDFYIKEIDEGVENIIFSLENQYIEKGEVFDFNNLNTKTNDTTIASIIGKNQVKILSDQTIHYILSFIGQALRGLDYIK